MWSAHQRATNATHDAEDGVQRLASQIAKQSSMVDVLVDRSRALAARAQDLSGNFARIGDSFSRLELVALNAGLEGSRAGENGKPLAMVADEVRAQATRGSEATRELSVGLAEIGSELVQVQGTLDRTREGATEISEEVTRIGGALADAERSITEIGERFKRATGSDPDTARAIAEAGEHALALAKALGSLGGKVPQALLVGALRPVLEPLEKLLSDDGDT